MIMASIGSVMLTGVLMGDIRGDVIGILSATLSGLLTAMYLVGNKVTYDRGLHPATNLCYVSLFSFPFCIPFINMPELGAVFSDPVGISMALGLGIGLTLIPFYLVAWAAGCLLPSTSTVISTLEVGRPPSSDSFSSTRRWTSST